MIEIKLPYPPSVNRMWRTVKGRTLLCAEGRAYRDAVRLEWLQRPSFERVTRAGRLHVELIVMAPDNRRRDLDNLPKAILDALQHAGVYKDDSQIDRLLIERGSVVKGGYVQLRLHEVV